MNSTELLAVTRRPKTAKEMIIHLLGNRWPLTAKEIHNVLVREYSFSGSYQATHKHIQELLTETVVIKNSGKYQLNSGWLEKLKLNANSMFLNVVSGRQSFSLAYVPKNSSVNLTFTGILDVGYFLIDKLMAADEGSNTKNIALWRFCYSIVGLEEKHLVRLKESFAKNDWFAVVQENNPVDKVFGDTLLSYGLKKIVFGIPCATPLSDKMVVGDYVVEIIYPSFFRKLWSLQNKLPKQMADFNLAKHFLLMRELQPKIEVIVTNNPVLANELREEFLEYF